MKTRKMKLPKNYIQRGFDSLVPASLNEEKRTVDVIVSTGARGLRMSWLGDYYEELAIDKKSIRMDRLNSGAPVLNSHDSSQLNCIIGAVVKAWIANGQLMATLQFSDREDVQPIWNDVKAGLIRNISVGYMVYNYEEVPVPDGETPVYRATDWEPVEVSFVAIPFDAGAQVRGIEGADFTEVSITENEKTANNGDEVTDQENKLLQEGERSMTPEEIEKQKQEAEAKAKADGIRQERQRVSDIRSAVQAAQLGAEFEKELIAQDITADEARKLVLEKVAEERSKTQVPAALPRVEVTVDEREKYRDGASQWLIERAGAGVKSLMEKHTGKKIDGGEFRGMSLIDLARESLERSGVKTRGMSKMEMVGQAFTYRSGFNTTSDFPYILENTLHKVLLGSYATTQDTWSRFCKKGTVTDFRAHPRYRLGSFGSLDSLNEHGEFKTKSIPDAEKSSITAGTKGNVIGLSRQSIINDDMGAFNDLATRFGRAAKLSVETDVYALIGLNSGMGPTQSDSQPFFHANRSNVNGTGSALSAAGIDADRVVMGAQKDPSGNEVLDLRPAILLVPLGLGGQARVINLSQFDPDNLGSGSKAVNRPNVVAGLFRDVVDTARLTGTRRYLFADPDVAPAFEVAFLDGQDSPFLEAKDGWRMDGVEWKVRLDYGCAAVDPRGAVTNAGV